VDANILPLSLMRLRSKRYSSEELDSFLVRV